MSVDMIYAIGVLAFSGGWHSLFVLYAFSSLVLPSLLYGWRGGVMAGLAFATLNAAALWAIYQSPTDIVITEGWQSLIVMMAAPAIFGCAFPGVAEILRRVAAGRRPRRPAPSIQRLERDVGGDALRFTPVGRIPQRGRPGELGDTPLAAQATKIRAAEQSVEDLRRAIFSPLPAPDMDLAAA